MVSVTTVLVLACAVAINAHALKDFGRCTYAHIGVLSGQPIKLPTTYLDSGTCDWNVKIPNIPNCPFGINGAVAKVCDNDVAPNPVQFIDMTSLYVHRNGQCLGLASVDITVYCNTYPPSVNHQQPYVSPQNSQGVATVSAVPQV